MGTSVKLHDKWERFSAWRLRTKVLRLVVGSGTTLASSRIQFHAEDGMLNRNQYSHLHATQPSKPVSINEALSYPAGDESIGTYPLVGHKCYGYIRVDDEGMICEIG